MTEPKEPSAEAMELALESMEHLRFKGDGSWEIVGVEPYARKLEAYKDAAVRRAVEELEEKLVASYNRQNTMDEEIAEQYGIIADLEAEKKSAVEAERERADTYMVALKEIAGGILNINGLQCYAERPLLMKYASAILLNGKEAANDKA